MIRFPLLAICAMLAHGFTSSTSAQGTASQVFVTTEKTTFVWGERVKVKAVVRDVQGAELIGKPITWSVIPDGSGTIATDGTITPLQLRNLTIRATSGDVYGDILVQPIPKKIVVTLDEATMTVGSTQRVRAAALDINDRPIPNAPIQWSLSNALGGDSNNMMASIDSLGNLRSLVAGRVQVHASIFYDYNPWFLSYYEGTAYVQMMAPRTYKFERVFTAKSAGNASVLAPLPSALLPANGGVDFVASLDGLGSAFMEWTPDRTTPIAVSGRAHISTGQPLVQFGNIARNRAGDVLFSETDAGGVFQISAGPVEHAEPLLVRNTPLNGADSTSGFIMGRNSLADTGYKVFQAAYSDAVTHTVAQGLFRGLGTGLSEMIVNTIDGVNASAGKTFNFDSFGVADDGTVWFVLQIDPEGLNRSVLFRARPGLGPEVMLAQGETLQGATVTSLTTFNFNRFSANFFVAGNGDLVMGVNTSQGGVLLHWSSSSAAPDTVATKTGWNPGSDGIYWYDPSTGALVNRGINNGPPGLYLWKASGVTPLVTIGTTAVGGSVVREIFSATADSQGFVYAMVRTDVNPMVIARVLPNVQALLKAGDTISIGGVPLIGAMIPGADTGTPLLLTGGQTGGVSKITGPSSVQPLMRVGDPVPGGGAYTGSTITFGNAQARSLSDGRIVVADANGIYTWNNGSVDWFVKFPIPSADGPLFGSFSSFTVNRHGDLAGNFANNIVVVRNGTATRVLGYGRKLGPASVYYGSVPIIDDSGQVAFMISDAGGQNYVAFWDGSTSRIILSPGSVMPDGRMVQSVDLKLAGGGGFLVTTVSLNDGQNTYVRYRSGGWEYIAGKNERTATGNIVQGGSGTFDINIAGDLAFDFSGGSYNEHIAAKRGAAFQEIQALSDLTPDGDALIGVTQILLNDDGTVFVLAVNDQSQQVIYRATPVQPPVSINFQISDRSGTSQTTSGSGNSVQAGFGRIIPNAGSSTPSGMAIFDFAQNGVLISEAAVPASPLIQSGRTYAEIGGPVDTGIAIANPNTQVATINFYYTDATGRNVFSGTTTVGANSQISAFLDQAPFVSQATDLSAVRTFTFSSSIPVGVTALRGYTNQRGEFLITTLPVVPLDVPRASTAFAFPHYADGGGWISTVVLVNPTDAAITGTAQFYSKGNTRTAGVPVTLVANGTSGSIFNYTIPPRGAFKLQTAGTGSAVQSGWVKVTPSSGSITPSGLVVFSFQSNGVRVSEAGVPALPSSSAFRMYAEALGTIQTGMAISNPDASNVSVNFELTNLDGTSTGITGSTTVPATGQVAMFLNQIPGFSALPASFKGILRISGANVFVTGLRGRYNERGDFLITTTAPVDETAPPSTSEYVFPQLADGGGYTTQIILFSGTAGQSATGVLQFLSQSGEPLTPVLQ